MSGTSRLERSTVDSIIMKALPFLKRIPSSLMRLFSVPDQHFGIILDSDFLAISFDDGFGVIQEIVGVDDGDANFTIFQLAMLSSNGWTNLLLLAEEVENAAKFVVSGLLGHEVVEPGDLVEGWDGAAVVGGNAVTWVSDQECEVELLQDLCWNDGWISGLGFGVIRVWSFMIAVRSPVVGPVRVTVRKAIGMAIRLAICSDSFLGSLSTQRWSNSGLFSLWRNQVVGDVLDEEAFSLF